MRSLGLMAGIAATLLISAPALAVPFVGVAQAPTGNGTSFTGTFLVNGLAPSASFSNIDVPITTHSNGVLEVTLVDTIGGTGLKSLTAVLDGTSSLSQTVTAGLNNLVFSGKTGSNPGFFSGSFTFTSTTPEPAAWMMMIAGLGVVGGMMHRQRKLLAV